MTDELSYEVRTEAIVHNEIVFAIGFASIARQGQNWGKHGVLCRVPNPLNYL
jgi:hypothetical protein